MLIKLLLITPMVDRPPFHAGKMPALLSGRERGRLPRRLVRRVLVASGGTPLPPCLKFRRNLILIILSKTISFISLQE
jgi:hypothetical protein